ncbi:site-specific integrase [Acidovorax sp. CCYZU-2555]|uniref:site-specific integrase n=1 Tax=Acidovorax sp. CCYZU-2555 TaxID=2835042 RepID=UPI001BCB4375|nr:site-specific integrase [Acidovorax sp. CCYZU-2555]MBS7777736.1 site-specific integrase [Acidovorax sp. CCYZU-2555]
MMALLTGARANELAQLRLSDIKDDQLVPFFDINEDADSDGERRKSLKTKTSKRHVPIHPKLIELGFLDYVQEIRSAGHWCLFREMEPQKATGERPVYNSQMANWFFRYRKACDVLKNEDGKPVFHSFRHTAATRLENADVPLHRLSGVLGHLQDGEYLQTYAKLDKAKVRTELVKMEFPHDVMNALPSWKDIEFSEPQPLPVVLGLRQCLLNAEK